MDYLGLFSRRNMLLGLGGATAAGAATVGGGSTASFFEQILRPSEGGRTDVALRSAAYNDWAAQVGSNFTAHSGHVLKLVDVQRFGNKGARPHNLRQQAFVARFDISRGGGLPEELYRVAHPNGDTFEMFLTKGSPDKPLRMLAVFS